MICTFGGEAVMRQGAERRLPTKWLRPGMGVKRWLLCCLPAGSCCCASRLRRCCKLVEPYRLADLSSWDCGRPSSARRYRWRCFFTAGGAAVALAVYGLSRSLLSCIPAHRSGATWSDVVYQHRQRRRGPKVVAIGGGHGLNTLLRGLKQYTDNITAIVTVADDGGSSGRLRRDLGILPPGDFRNCIAALSDAEGLVSAALPVSVRR